MAQTNAEPQDMATRLVDFFEEHIDLPQHWVEFDTARILASLDFRTHVTVVSDGSKSKYNKQDVRNFLLRFIGVRTNILWPEAKLPIDDATHRWLEALELRLRDIPTDVYEFFVLCSAYGPYLCENNLKLFIANFPSFTTLSDFYNLLHYIHKHVHFSKIKLRTLFNSQFTELDDIMDEVMQKCSAQIIPRYQEVLCHMKYFHTISKNRQSDALMPFRDINLPRLFMFPPRIMNTLLLWLSNSFEMKTKSTYFSDLITIAYNTNNKMNRILPLVNNKRLASDDASDDSD